MLDFFLTDLSRTVIKKQTNKNKNKIKILLNPKIGTHVSLATRKKMLYVECGRVNTSSRTALK